MPTEPLVCAECGRADPGDEPGWTLRLNVDDELQAFCPECGERGQLPPGRRTAAHEGQEALKTRFRMMEHLACRIVRRGSSWENRSKGETLRRFCMQGDEGGL
jgi:hypothetical protein